MALLAGDWVLRERVLTLVSTVAFPEESVASLAKAMNSTEPLLMTSDKCNGKVLVSGDSMNTNFLQSFNGKISGLPYNSPQKLSEELPPLTREQESRLDSFISTLQKAKDDNKIEDIAMSALIELYEYKLGGMGHAERALQANLDSSTTHLCLLQHKLAQSSVELSRLHQLMYYKQQCLEGCQAEKQQLTLKLQNEELKAMEKHTQHMQEMRGKMREIEVSQRKEATLRKEFEAMAKEKEEEKAEYSKSLTALMERVQELEESIQKKDKLLEDKQRENEKLYKVNKDQQEDNNSLRLVNKRNEQIILEKEAKIKETSKELQELQRIREVIYEISAGKKKMEK
ncbi:golgin subfamily A member 6-like protein 26 [Hetaerina americana]